MKNLSTEIDTKNPGFDSSRGNELAHREGPVAKAIEQQTAKVPSDVFLWAGLGAVGAAFGLRLLGKKDAAVFVGEWAPTILILGLYNKLVKVAGSDRSESPRSI